MIPRLEDLSDVVQLRRQVQSMFNIPVEIDFFKVVIA